MSSAWSRWELRSPLAEVAARYYAEKFWTDASFGELVDEQLREQAVQIGRRQQDDNHRARDEQQHFPLQIES